MRKHKIGFAIEITRSHDPAANTLPNEEGPESSFGAFIIRNFASRMRMSQWILPIWNIAFSI